MTEEEEDKYLFAQDLTRLRIAADVLHEVIHEDFRVEQIVIELRRQVDCAYRKMEAARSKDGARE